MAVAAMTFRMEGFMRMMACKACGSNDLVKEKDRLKCAYCGTVYVSEASRSIIDLDGDIEALLQKCKDNPSNARRYANLILDIDPGNRDALRYL